MRILDTELPVKHSLCRPTSETDIDGRRLGHLGRFNVRFVGRMTSSPLPNCSMCARDIALDI